MSNGARSVISTSSRGLVIIGAESTLTICDNDAGSLTMTHNGQVVAGPETWDTLIDDNPEVAAPIVQPTGAVYSADAQAWMLSWGNYESCWIPNTVIVNDNNATHPTGERLSAAPPVQPIGWIHDRAVYRTTSVPANDCTTAADTATLYLHRLGEPPQPVLPELSGLNALTFNTP